MGALDQAVVVKDESSYGTAVVVNRAFEINSEDITEDWRRTEGDPLRVATFFKRDDRHTPYFGGAAGPIELDVMTKGFGFWLKHMFGGVADTGPAETTAYTHTSSIADLYGKSFTCQVQRPFHPSGTAQAFTYAGGKVTKWELKNSVDANLVASIETDFQKVSTATSLVDATSLYPSGMENLCWAGGVVTIGGTQVALDEIAIAGDNGLAVDRRKIDGSTDKKEPTGGRREGTFSFSADFESLSQRAYVAAATAAGNTAEIVAKWTGPTLLGTTIYPSLQITIQARLDEWKGNLSGPEGIQQELSGVVRSSGADSMTAVYVSADTTA